MDNAIFFNPSPHRQMSTPETLDWLAIAQTERHDLISELQRQLGLNPAQKNEAMRCAVAWLLRGSRRAYAHARARANAMRRFLEVHRDLLLAAKEQIEESERDDRRQDAALWRETTRCAARERSIRCQHAARASAAAAAHGADATAATSFGSTTWDKALELVGALPRPAAGPRSSSVSRAFTETLKKAHEAMDKGQLGGAPA